MPLAVLLLCLGGVLASCAPASAGPRGRDTPTACITAAKTPATDEERLGARVQAAVCDLTQQVQSAYSAGDGTVTVTATVGWTADITLGEVGKEQERVKTITFRAQSALWTSGIALKKATVVVMGPVLNDYGETVTDAHGVADLGTTSAAGFDWARLTPDAAWDRYDSAYLRPGYRPHYLDATPTH